MRKFRLWVVGGIVAGTLAVSSCGGGGVTALATFVGRVLQVETGGPPNPQASVQVGSNSSLTSASDGSFQLSVPTGTTTLIVDSLTSTSGVWTFTVPAASGVTDVGDLWIGPERVKVRGTVRDSTTLNPVAGASVEFAGRAATTNASGVFELIDVAYASSTQTAFWGILGSIRHSSYFKADFSTQPNLAQAGVVEVGDLFLTPLSDPNPPGPPYNIWGVVTAPGGAQGAIVRLKLNSNDIRVYNVGADGKYFFFVVPGDYVVSASKDALTAPDQSATLTQPNEVIRRDFNLQ